MKRNTSKYQRIFRDFGKNLLTILLVLLFISAFFALFSSSGKPKAEVPLSQLMSQIGAGKVKEIYVKGDILNIVLKSGQAEKSMKEPQSSFIDIAKSYGIEPSALKNIKIQIQETGKEGVIWMTLLGTILPIILIGALFWFMIKSAQKGQMQVLRFGQSTVKMANQGKGEKITFADVADLKEAKEELREIVDFLRNPRKYQAIGAKIPRGVLLMGAPGTGKTLLARAVSGEANVPFFHISGSEFVEMFVGVGASRVRSLFRAAKKAAPSIVFIDEIDAVGRLRGSGLGGGHDEREQTLNQILVEMDGFDKDTHVIVIAATNRPDVLDPALLRPGRFDRRVVLDMPDIEARLEILKLHARHKPLEKNVDLKEIAERTPGFSGADLENLLNEAAILAAKEGKKTVSQEDIYESIEKVLLGREKKSQVFTQRDKKIAAYHEAGHALVAHSLPYADAVRKVSIIPRGRAAGYTLKMPAKDKKFYSRKEFLDEIATLLGGYSAEKIVFGDVTTGASNDLIEASRLARDLVTRYGMSQAIGPVTFGRRDELIFLGKELAERRNFSEKTAAKIDKEIEKIVSRAYRKASEVIKSKRDILDRIAGKLIEKETLEQKEFNKIVGEPKAKPPEGA